MMQGLIPGVAKTFFSSPKHLDWPFRPTQPPVRWVPGVILPGVKWLVHDATMHLHLELWL